MRMKGLNTSVSRLVKFDASDNTVASELHRDQQSWDLNGFLDEIESRKSEQSWGLEKPKIFRNMTFPYDCELPKKTGEKIK